MKKAKTKWVFTILFFSFSELRVDFSKLRKMSKMMKKSFKKAENYGKIAKSQKLDFQNCGIRNKIAKKTKGDIYSGIP